jgi:hypothetical protein
LSSTELPSTPRPETGILFPNAREGRTSVSIVEEIYRHSLNLPPEAARAALEFIEFFGDAFRILPASAVRRFGHRGLSCPTRGGLWG